MSLQFAPHGRAMVGHVAIWVTMRDGVADTAQLGLARQIVAQLTHIEHIAGTYLDMFVDRARACGNGDEPWFLDEIDLRAASGDRPVIPLIFALDGDDNGLWTVDLRLSQDQFWPVRLERLQQ